jgi:hypothetical protein
VPAEARRVMERNREARARGPARSVVPVSPELLRLLFARRRGGAGGGGDADSDGYEGVGGEDTEDSEGCRMS